MALGGAFNVSHLIKELGLKAVEGDAMRVLETIQPTLVIGDLHDSTPAHQPPTALFGFVAQGTPSNVGLFEIQCLSPGGAFVGWFSISTVFTGAAIRVVTTGAGVSNVVPSAGQLSRAPVVSIAREGNISATTDPGVQFVTDTQQLFFGFRDLYIPKGSFFQVELTSVNTISAIGVHWREIPAMENNPA